MKGECKRPHLSSGARAMSSCLGWGYRLFFSSSSSLFTCCLSERVCFWRIRRALSASCLLFHSFAHFAFHAPVSSAGRTLTSDSARAGKPGLIAGGRGMEVTPGEINSGLATFPSTNLVFSTVPWVCFTWFWAPCTVLALYGHKGHWYLDVSFVDCRPMPTEAPELGITMPTTNGANDPWLENLVLKDSSSLLKI